MTRPVLVDEVCGWFARHNGRPPDGAWRAPGRVNIIGEHTDYNDGFVLPMAISMGVTVCAARRADNRLVVMSRHAGLAAVQLDDLAPGSVTGWSAYPAGVAWALRQAGYVIGGASVAIDSDLPVGAGLSSSAALECAIALALTELSGLTVPRPELVQIARRAENDFVGVPTGIMDQSAALLCRAGHALLLDCRTACAAALPLDLAAAGRCLMIIDTAIRHALTEGSYSDRRRDCEAAARMLGVPTLRDVAGGPEQLDCIQDDALRRRARHVIEENRRVLQTAELLQDGQLPLLGGLMTDSHYSLRDDFDVSWPQADAAVDAALTAGADGARMIGGGFGGSVLALLPVALTASVTTSVSRVFRETGWPQPAFTLAQPSSSACRLS
jgi:galactokinase